MKYVYLAAPSLLALATPFYNSVDPQFLGVPFFFWFQLLLVPVSAGGIYLYHRAERG